MTCILCKNWVTHLVTCFILLIGWCIVAPTVAQSEMATGLELYSSMNNLTLGTPGVAPDDTGNGYDGDLYGSQQINDPTRGNVLGVNTTADCVDYGDVLDPGSQSYTVSCWMKIPDTDSTVSLINKGMETSSADPGFRVLSSSTDKFHVWANYGNDTSTRLGVKTTYVPDDAWHHIAFVIDQEHGVMKVYFDGNPSSDDAGNFNTGWELSGTTGYANTFTPGASFSNSDSLYIACPNSSTSTVGLFDDFAVWNRALSNEEIAGLAGGSPVPEPSLLVLLIGMLAVCATKRLR